MQWTGKACESDGIKFELREVEKMELEVLACSTPPPHCCNCHVSGCCNCRRTAMTAPSLHLQKLAPKSVHRNVRGVGRRRPSGANPLNVGYDKSGGCCSRVAAGRDRSCAPRMQGVGLDSACLP